MRAAVGRSGMRNVARCAAGALVGLLGAAPGAAHAVTMGPTPAASSLGWSFTRGEVTCVSALSAGNVWAVGDYYNRVTNAFNLLILHWDGTTWSKVRSPLPSSSVSFLNGVSASSATDAWAVGDYVSNATGYWETLILHWNGAAWAQVMSPNTSREVNILAGVSAAAANDAWAAGYSFNYSSKRGGSPPGPHHMLVLHWDGTSWTKVARPKQESSSRLSGVYAHPGSDAWAVGDYRNITTMTYDTLILHRNRRAWSTAASPTPGSSSELTGVSAYSDSDAWAVGNYRDATTGATETLIVHWNGTTWSKVASPDPSASYNVLSGVSSDALGNAWAVGSYYDSATGATDTLTLRWNGTAWSMVQSPNPSAICNVLNSVSVDSSSDAWAVGYTIAKPSCMNLVAQHTLVLHWNGATWTTTLLAE